MPRIVYDLSTQGGAAVANVFEGIAVAAKRSQEELDRQNRRTKAGLAATSAAVRDLRASAEASLSQLGPLGSALSALGKAGPAGAAIAGIAGVTAGLAAAAVTSIRMADQLKDAADVAGISVERFQSLRYALTGIGVDEAKLSGFLNKFEANLGGVYNGVGPLTKALKTIDPALLDAIKHTPQLQGALDLILQKMASMPNSAQKAALAVASFGKGSQALAAAANTSATGLSALEEEAHRVGAVIDEELLQAASQASDKLDQMAIVIKANLMASFLAVSPEVEAFTQKVIDMTGAVARFLSGRQPGEKATTPEIQGMSDDLATLERFRDKLAKSLEGEPTFFDSLVGSREARQQELASVDQDIKDLQRKRAAAAEQFQADEAARAAAGAPVDTGPDDAARKKAQTDQERADKILADARRAAATAGLEGEERAREQAKQDIIEKTAELQKLITDEKKAAEAIAAYKVEREKELQGDLAKIRGDAADKQKAKDEQHQKQQDAATRRAEGQVRAASRARTSVGGDTEESIWTDAKEAFEEYQHDVDEGIEDQQKKAQLLAEFWVQQEGIAQAKILDLREKNADKAATAAEAALKKEAAAQAKFLAPIESAIESIGNSLVDAFLQGSDGAKSFGDVATGVIKSIVAEIAQMAIKKAVAGPLAGLLGGAASTAGAAAGTASSDSETVAGFEDAAQEATGALESFGGSLLKYAGVAVAVAGTLAQAGQGIAEGRKDIKEASRGTDTGGAFTGFAAVNTAAFVAGGAAAGAAVGAAGFGVGALVGAAVGAAVGGAIATAINKNVASGIAGGIDHAVDKGLDQSGLDKSVTQKLQKSWVSFVVPLFRDEMITTVLLAGANKVLGPLLIEAFTPSIERIFEKILRQGLGGTGGIDTSGIPVDPRGYSGLRSLAPAAGRGGRIIAEAFGAGGPAFGTEREARFTSLLLAATKKESERTGEEAGVTLAEVFVTAFQGQFMAALTAAFKTGKGRREADFKFVAEQFTKVGGGFNYQQVADVVQRQGLAPGEKAMKASTAAVGSALQAAFTDAANSQAFRRSLAESVAQAFGAKASQVLTKSLGDIFAPFFAISKDVRRDYRRARRQGDFPEAVDILSDDFLSRVQDFAKVAADPQIAISLGLMADAMLQLQVATAAASGDIVGAAAAIEAALGASIQQLRDVQQLRRDVESRTRLALAGPGIAGDRESVADASRRRREAQDRLKGFGEIGFFGGSQQPFGATIGAGGTTEITPLQPSEILGPLKEFAEARLDELEQEIALARQLRDTFEALANQFQSLRLAVDVTLGRNDPTADIAEKMAKVRAAQAAIGSTNIDEVDPEKFADLATALSDAIGAATARFQELTQAISTFDGIARGIADTLGGMAGQKSRLTDLFGSMAKLLPAVVGGGAGSSAATGKLATQLQDAVGIATSRRQFFAQSQEGFEGIRDQAAIAARGQRAQRAQLARGRAELAALLPRALQGDADALARAQALSSQILTLAGSGARGRRVAREIEGQASLLAKASAQQQTIAEGQLAALEAIAQTAKDALDRQKTAVEQQLDDLGAIASEAHAQTTLLFVGFGVRVEQVRAELETFRTTYGPLIASLETAARVTLHDDLEDIKTALGTDGEVVKAIRLVEARLPAGVTDNSGRSLAVTNSVAPQAEPVTMNTTVNLTVTVPPGTSPAQARELGRSTAAGVDEAVTQVLRKRGVTLGLRKVA